MSATGLIFHPWVSRCNHFLAGSSLANLWILAPWQQNTSLGFTSAGGIYEVYDEGKNPPQNQDLSYPSGQTRCLAFKNISTSLIPDCHSDLCLVDSHSLGEPGRGRTFLAPTSWLKTAAPSYIPTSSWASRIPGLISNTRAMAPNYPSSCGDLKRERQLKVSDQRPFAHKKVVPDKVCSQGQ